MRVRTGAAAAVSAGYTGSRRVPPCPFAVNENLAGYLCRERRPRRPAEGSSPLPTKRTVKGVQPQTRGPGMPGPQRVEKPPSAREVPRRGGGREPCHSPKYFGQPYSSLPHRLRAEPPRRGGQGVSTPFSTVCGPGMPGPYIPVFSRYYLNKEVPYYG